MRRPSRRKLLAAWGSAEAVKLGEVSPGDLLICDAGFTCLALGATVQVEAAPCGCTFIRCREGTHALDGQVDDEDDDTLVGLRRVAKASAARQ